MRISSLNLGYRVMDNQIQGSEALFVEICQMKYNGGWNDKHQISECSKRASDFLIHYDLFGLQEMNKSRQKEFEKYLLGKRKYILETSSYLQDCGVTIGYDPKIFGKGVVITPRDFVFGDLQIGRGMIAIWFPKKELLFINLHAPHDIPLIREIEKAGKEIEKLFLNKIGNLKRIQRVIMVGDFNDGEASLLNGEISLFKKTLSLPSSFVPHTCCTADGYQYVGDYILDSEKKDVYFGLPPGYYRYTDAFSDHDPVVLIEYYQG